jgi:hypothetical protein
MNACQWLTTDYFSDFAASVHLAGLTFKITMFMRNLEVMEVDNKKCSRIINLRYNQIRITLRLFLCFSVELNFDCFLFFEKFYVIRQMGVYMQDKNIY